MDEEKDQESIDEEIDPRIKEELDTLNRSTDEINLVETQLTEWREKYNASLATATEKLQKLSKKNPKSIERARNYYETKQSLAQAQLALQRAVSNFQRANGVYRAAKETIDLAESRLSEFDDKKVDQAWQEMLNIQTQRFMEAESDRRRSQDLHQKAAKKFEYLEKKLQALKKKNKTSIAKAKVYFELKGLLEKDLQAKRVKVDELQRRVDASKRRYRESLNNLEQISSEIHAKRRESQTSAQMLENVHSSNGSLQSNPLNLNTIGLSTYDDIDDLEAELDDFELSDGDDDEILLSSTETETESESEESTRSHNKRPQLRRSNTAPASRFKPALAQKPNLRARQLRRNSSEETAVVKGRGNGMAAITEASESLFSDEGTDKNDSTYTRLHGVNIQSEVKKGSATAKKAIPQADEFDIFDELC